MARLGLDCGVIRVPRDELESVLPRGRWMARNITHADQMPRKVSRRVTEELFTAWPLMRTVTCMAVKAGSERLATCAGQGS